jgi:hypothetical protein
MAVRSRLQGGSWEAGSQTTSGVQKFGLKRHLSSSDKPNPSGSSRWNADSGGGASRSRLAVPFGCLTIGRSSKLVDDAERGAAQHRAVALRTTDRPRYGIGCHVITPRHWSKRLRKIPRVVVMASRVSSTAVAPSNFQISPTCFAIGV